MNPARAQVGTRVFGVLSEATALALVKPGDTATAMTKPATAARCGMRGIIVLYGCRPAKSPVGGHSRTLAQARLLGDTVVVERALSQDTQPSPTAGNGLASVRPLTAPTRRELEALAEIFDQYRAHYGEPPDTSRSARWLDENLITSRLRTFVAEDKGRFVAFAITMEVPASLRLAHFWQIKDLFVLPTHRRLGIGRALLASVRAAAIESGVLRLVLQTEDDNDPALRLYADSGYTLIKGYCSLMLPLGDDPR